MPTEAEIAVLKEQALRNIQDHQEIKSEISEVKCGIKNITDKLDAVINSKADKEEVKTVQSDIKTINIGLLNQARQSVTQTVGIIITAVGLIITLLIALSNK